MQDLRKESTGSLRTGGGRSLRRGLLLSASAGMAATAIAMTGFAGVASASIQIDGKTISENSKLAAMVPAAIKSTGMTDITYNNAPPDEQVVGGQNVGWEIDLGRAVAEELGLKWNLTTSANFEAFIPGLQNGRYNSSFTSFIETAARLKEIDIVTYYNVGTGFAVPKGSKIKITSPTSLCGHSVAVIEGSAFIQQIESIKCPSNDGKISVDSFPSDSAAELAVSSGRADVYSSSEDQLSYLIKKTAHEFVLQKENFDPVPEGAGITKGSGLTKPVAAAMDALIKSGAYAAIMKKWSLVNGLVTKATVYSDTK